MLITSPFLLMYIGSLPNLVYYIVCDGLNYLKHGFMFNIEPYKLTCEFKIKEGTNLTVLITFLCWHKFAFFISGWHSCPCEPLWSVNDLHFTREWFLKIVVPVFGLFFFFVFFPAINSVPVFGLVCSFLPFFSIFDASNVLNCQYLTYVCWLNKTHYRNCLCCFWLK